MTRETASGAGGCSHGPDRDNNRACRRPLPGGDLCPANKVEPDRLQPFREFALIYHDEIGAVQAFPQLGQKPLWPYVAWREGGFAINYSANGLGAEILANRIGVGPMHACTECYFEEFFSASWAIGDPGEIVDVPANASCTKEQIECGTCTPTPGPKATKVLFPGLSVERVSQLHGDHVKMRIIHGGSKEHHIHHLHAHQWLHTPDSDNSILPRQPGNWAEQFVYTEIAYNGGGNRNKTVGDSIFHCHFYPHFAKGMWALWRVHDVLETGTALDTNGRPTTTTRALPTPRFLPGRPYRQSFRCRLGRWLRSPRPTSES